jgi:hypothetical protein
MFSPANLIGKSKCPVFGLARTVPHLEGRWTLLPWQARGWHDSIVSMVARQ